MTGGAPLDLRVLGPLEVHGPDGQVAVGSAMQRRLLAALAVQPGSVVSVDRLIAVLWDDTPPPTALTSLRTYVARLRADLRTAGVEPPPIITSAPGYLLDIEPAAIDAYRFEHAVRQAQWALPVDPAGAAETMRRALVWWRGPAFAEFADAEFARLEAIRLEELRLVGRETHAQAQLEAGRVAEAVAALEGLVAEQPLREDARALLMTCLARVGRAADALDGFGSYQRQLREDFGLDPSDRLRALQQEILTGDLPDPPVPAARRRLGNLPVVRTGLVGRDSARAELAGLLRRHRVVTLTGTGGVGKTALALQAATDVAGDFPDGAWWCELAGVRTADAVPHSVAAAVGVILAPDRPPHEGLAAALESRRMLVVLDNCEHVIEGAASLVEAVTRTCPEVSVLATSRERLGVEGEQVRPIEPLPVPDRDADAAERSRRAPAVVLFEDRVRAVRPDFAVATDNAELVGRLCRSLDGLPLALELAAGRLGALSLADLVDRLGRRPDLVSGHRRGGDARHRTLRQLVDWSYDLLSDPERRLFERLSVFAGGFTLAHAERVCADADLPAARVADLVAGLVDKSMVVRGDGAGPGRYRMLETLRAYAQDRLESRGQAAETRRAHAECLVDFATRAAEGLTGPAEREWAGRLDAEVDNLRIVHRWALDRGAVDIALQLSAALHRFAFWRNRYELLGWAAPALDLAVGGSTDLVAARQHPETATVLASAGIAAWTSGDLATAAARAERASDLVRASNDQVDGLPVELVGDAALFGGRPRDAADAYGRAARAFRRVGDLPAEVFNLGSQAVAYAYAGDQPRAAEIIRETQDRARASGNPTARAYALYAEGECLLDVSPDRALDLLEAARRVADTVANEFVGGVATVSIASLLARHGDDRRALGSFAGVIDRWRRTGNWMQQWTTLRNLAELLVRLEAYESAAVLYAAAACPDRASSVYGAEADRLDAAWRRLAGELGADALDALSAKGRTTTGEEAVALASDEIARLRTP